MKYDIYHFYDEVFLRPELFTGEKTITSIKQFLMGAKTALERFRINEPTPVGNALHGEYLGFEFDRWLCKKIKAHSFQHACDLICERASSEAKGLEHLTILYEEYRGNGFGADTRYTSNTNVII